MHYEFGRASRIGNRDSNQDRMAALEGDGGTVLVLADGMGGQSGGALAAQTVVDFVSNEFSRLRFPVPYPQNCLTRMLHLQQRGKSRGVTNQCTRRNFA